MSMGLFFNLAVCLRFTRFAYSLVASDINCAAQTLNFLYTRIRVYIVIQ